MSLLNDSVQDMPACAEKDAIALLGRARDKVNSTEAWNILFDAQVYLVNRDTYRQAYGPPTLEDRLFSMVVGGNSVVFGQYAVIRKALNQWRVAEVGGDWLMHGNLDQVAERIQR